MRRLSLATLDRSRVCWYDVSLLLLRSDAAELTVQVKQFPWHILIFAESLPL